MKDGKVAVIVLNWNGKHFLEECLGTVLSQSCRNYVVYFVDNGSSDGSVDFVKGRFRDRRLKIIRIGKNCGYAEGNNVGIREALRDKYIEYVIILNNDTRVDSRFIREFVKGAEKHSDAGSFACRIVVYSNPDVIDSAGMLLYKNCMPSGRGIGEPAENFGKEEEVFGAVGAAAMYRRGMLEDVADNGSYYDPDFFLYQEEFDLSWRAQLRGWKCYYIPNAVVHHIGSGVMRKFSRQVKYFLERNRFWAVAKNASSSVLMYSLPHIILYEIISLPLYATGWYLPSVIKGRIHGIAGMGKMLRKRRAALVPESGQIRWMVPRNYFAGIRLNILGRR